MLETTEASGATVAALSGACSADDLERALVCDIRLAADTATFSGDGLSEDAAARLARLLGEARAKDIVLTGRRFDAREALRLGVVTRVVEAALPARSRAERRTRYVPGPGGAHTARTSSVTGTAEEGPIGCQTSGASAVA